MSNRPKTKSKIQYGDSPTQPAGAKAGKSNAGAGASGGNPMGAKIAIGDIHPIVAAFLVLGLFGGIYLACAMLMKIPEIRGVTARLGRFIKK